MLLNWTTPSSQNIGLYRYGANRVYIGSPAQPFAPGFIEAATADVRCPRAMVEVTWGDSITDLSRVISSNDINRIDRTGQLFNGEEESGGKWAYIHSGLKADGTFGAMSELDTEPQVGWYGSSLVGDGLGDFSTAPYLQVTHLARPYGAFTVAGDSEYNEYPVDFDIILTHPGGPTTINVTGNTERIYTTNFSPIADVTAVKVEITKWSAPSTVVKITQFSGAFIELYKSDDIVELSILEESNSDTGIVPIGNVSANELDLTLLNTDRRFSHGNTDSVYVNVLRSGRKIRVWLGFILPVGSTDQTGDVVGYIVETVAGEKIGYMPYGIYWSKDWISSYDSMVTKTTAYDIVYQLSQNDFLRGVNYSGTVESIVDDVLTEAKVALPALDWIISSDTGSITWADVAFENKNYLEVLKDIAEATLSYTYVDRQGTLVVGSRLEVDTGTLESWQEIGLDTYFNYKSDPKIDELINLVRVGYTRYTLGAAGQNIYSDDEIFTIPAGATEIQLYITWSKRPVLVSSVIVALATASGSATLTDVDAYANGADITVTGNPGDTFSVTASGQPYELEENTETTAEDLDSINIYGVREFELTGNRLITYIPQAQQLADDLIEFYGGLRNDGSIKWYSSTLVSIGDTLEIVEFKSDTVETKTLFLINRQSIRYAGYLEADTSLRRG